MDGRGTLVELVLVLRTLTQEPAPVELPIVMVVPKAAMPCACDAAYMDEKLHIRNDIDWHDPRWLSIVLHELAHHRQFLRSGIARDCTEWMRREREALEIQTQYLEDVNSAWRPLNSYTCTSVK